MLVTTVMHEEGVVDDAKKTMTRKVGMLTAKLYRQRHGKEPSKHPQQINGRYIMVYTYSQEDRDLVVQAIDACA